LTIEGFKAKNDGLDELDLEENEERQWIDFGKMKKFKKDTSLGMGSAKPHMIRRIGSSVQNTVGSLQITEERKMNWAQKRSNTSTEQNLI
jgi:hypothetical protein